MGNDPIQCTRAYLTLWKLVDRLFPDSRWLEIGPVPHSELQANAQKLSDLDSDLRWCDNPEKLRGYATRVLEITHQQLDAGAIVNADRLRAELRDEALNYAEDIRPNSSELSTTFNWTLTESEDGT